MDTSRIAVSQTSLGTGKSPHPNPSRTTLFYGFTFPPCKTSQADFCPNSNAYALDIDEYWTSAALASGNGVVISDLTFSSWKGTIIDPKRAPIQILCADAAPCTGLSLSNINMWTDTNAAEHYVCRSAYGSGYCLKGSGSSSYTTTTTISSAPTSYSGAKMASDLAAGFATDASIPIPTIPTSFYPGATPVKKLLNGSGAGAGAAGAGTTLSTSTTKATTSASSTSKATTTSASSGTCAAIYAQCGGSGYTGPTCCTSSTCLYPWYSLSR